jgi:hypothetical protein
LVENFLKTTKLPNKFKSVFPSLNSVVDGYAITESHKTQLQKSTEQLEETIFNYFNSEKPFTELI